MMVDTILSIQMQISGIKIEYNALVSRNWIEISKGVFWILNIVDRGEESRKFVGMATVITFESLQSTLDYPFFRYR